MCENTVILSTTRAAGVASLNMGGRVVGGRVRWLGCDVAETYPEVRIPFSIIIPVLIWLAVV